MSHQDRPNRGLLIDILELQYFVMLQNEEILAKLNDRSTRLSPSDQRALDQFTNILKGTNAKIDAAKQDKPAPGGSQVT